MDSRIGRTDEAGDKVIRVGRSDNRVALYQYQKGGFGVYLYENPDWQLNDEWLFMRYRGTSEAADELFKKIESALRVNN